MGRVGKEFRRQKAGVQELQEFRSSGVQEFRSQYLCPLRRRFMQIEKPENFTSQSAREIFALAPHLQVDRNRGMIFRLASSLSSTKSLWRLLLNS